MAILPILRVGTKVVCIDVSGLAPTHGERMPVKGQVYTVRRILTSNGVKCLRLREIVNKPAKYVQGRIECSFRASRFTIRRGK